MQYLSQDKRPLKRCCTALGSHKRTNCSSLYMRVRSEKPWLQVKYQRNLHLYLHNKSLQKWSETWILALWSTIWCACLSKSTASWEITLENLPCRTCFPGQFGFSNFFTLGMLLLSVSSIMVISLCKEPSMGWGGEKGLSERMWFNIYISKLGLSSSAPPSKIPKPNKNKDKTAPDHDHKA